MVERFVRVPEQRCKISCGEGSRRAWKVRWPAGHASIEVLLIITGVNKAVGADHR